jgi:hypothetical protein
VDEGGDDVGPMPAVLFGMILGLRELPNACVHP